MGNPLDYRPPVAPAGYEPPGGIPAYLTPPGITPEELQAVLNSLYSANEFQGGRGPRGAGEYISAQQTGYYNTPQTLRPGQTPQAGIHRPITPLELQQIIQSRPPLPGQGPIAPTQAAKPNPFTLPSPGTNNPVSRPATAGEIATLKPQYQSMLPPNPTVDVVNGLQAVQAATENQIAGAKPVPKGPNAVGQAFQQGVEGSLSKLPNKPIEMPRAPAVPGGINPNIPTTQTNPKGPPPKLPQGDFFQAEPGFPEKLPSGGLGSALRGPVAQALAEGAAYGLIAGPTQSEGGPLLNFLFPNGFTGFFNPREPVSQGGPFVPRKPRYQPNLPPLPPSLPVPSTLPGTTLPYVPPDLGPLGGLDGAGATIGGGAPWQVPGDLTLHRKPSVEPPQDGGPGANNKPVPVQGTLNFTALADATPSAVGDVVTFTASFVSGGVAPFTYDWDFLDGEAGRGAIIGHKYTKAGVYTVGCRATDANGNVNDVPVVQTVQ